MKEITLSETNLKIPLLGLGTWQSKPDELEIAINSAIDSGYRLFDTAFNYNNEDIIGNVLKKCMMNKNIKRDELFITTKLPHIGNRASNVEKYLKLSLGKLQLDYVDLYLIHVPFGFMCDEATFTPKVDQNGNYQLDLTTDHVTIWKAMEDVMSKGLTKNIGLSNFNESQIDLIYQAARIKPQVLQVECHLYLQQASLQKYCQDKNIVLMAYSPLGSPGSQKHFTSKYNYQLENFPDVIGNPEVLKIAGKYSKSPGQILLKYLTHHDIVAIPKSSNTKRIHENIQLFDFELDADEVSMLKSLDRGEEGRIINFHFWNGVDKHPQYPFIQLK